jgi:sugar lactone lactonase YvrE
MPQITQLSQSCIHLNTILGECPLWHPLEACLYWLDIEAGTLFRYHPHNDHIETFSLGKRAGCFAFRQKGGLVIATENGLAFWNEQHGLSPNFIDLYPKGSANMMNDGRVDAAGRFWVGSKGPQGTSSLFCLDLDGKVTTVLEGVTISNGIDWSPDNRYCYYVDSGAATLYRYRFDLEQGMLYAPEVFFRPRKAARTSTPDGLCVDQAGNIWVAIWDGSCILQLSPEGEVLQEIRLPVNRPTSLTFGGEDLRDLYITSASTGFSSEEHTAQPLAGDVFSLRTLIPGIPANFFEG